MILLIYYINEITNLMKNAFFKVLNLNEFPIIILKAFLFKFNFNYRYKLNYIKNICHEIK